MSIVHSIAELVEAAEDALLHLDAMLGSETCDHEANICFCGVHGAMDRLRAALDSLEGRFNKAA